MCLLISKRFVFNPKAPNGIKNIKFDWSMPWSKETIKSPNIILEICNLLFNYMIINFNQASMFLKEKQGVDQYKQCLQKLQYVGSTNPSRSGLARS